MTTTLSRISLSAYRHIYLLVSLLLVITVQPFLPKPALGVGLIEMLLFLTLITGAYATVTGGRKLLLLGTLATLAVLARIAWQLYPMKPLLYGFLCTYIVFYSVVAYSLIRSLFRVQNRITANTFCGALSGYLILGLIWAMGYAILESVAPGSFLFGLDVTQPESRFDRFLGFSFTTLTTLGYGNVAPATPQADAITTLEAIVGQFYLVVVIARLIALQLTQEN